MKAYVIASLSLLVVCAVVAFVSGMILEQIFSPPQGGEWVYWVAVILGLFAGLSSFCASFRMQRRREKGEQL
jgi:formate hydrogenlyase subunit 3/multisubunit Na+/H+ antiporter MnhD subunit